MEEEDGRRVEIGVSENHCSLSTGLFDHCYRRQTLYSLYFYATPIKLADIADQITLWNYGPGLDDFLQKRLAIYDSLYYDHLPKLIEAEFVTYYQRDDMIDMGQRVDDDLQKVVRRLLQEYDDFTDTDQQDVQRSMEESIDHYTRDNDE